MRKRGFQASWPRITGLLLATVVPLGASSDQVELSSLVTIPVPHAIDSWATGISDSGQMVGSSISEETLGLRGWSSNGHSQWLVSVPGSSETVADDVNNRGDIVGAFVESGRTIGYVASSNGRVSRLELSGWEITYATGINDRRQVVADAVNADRSKPFLIENGQSAAIDIPEAISSGANDINNAGQVVGAYFDVENRLRGYLYDHGAVTSLLFPGSEYTSAVAINDRGQIVGNYGGANGNGSFFYWNGVFSELTAPNIAVSFFVTGINNSGTIVGQYSTLTDANAFFADLQDLHGVKRAAKARRRPGDFGLMRRFPNSAVARCPNVLLGAIVNASDIACLIGQR